MRNHHDHSDLNFDKEKHFLRCTRLSQVAYCICRAKDFASASKKGHLQNGHFRSQDKHKDAASDLQNESKIDEINLFAITAAINPEIAKWMSHEKQLPIHEDPDEGPAE
ncbi:hypothetical protein BHE74_00055078 [Ensete ventricosum]|nr:hypothetical protein GW17_00004499 [Ensete ventricosum]RWW39579.1 hypothetical protein BHE74_00055078 [Ensete ventricosum]RZS28121.1 hypothetical protein BHM03_00061683 [Ensete ventricosum]